MRGRTHQHVRTPAGTVKGTRLCLPHTYGPSIEGSDPHNMEGLVWGLKSVGFEGPKDTKGSLFYGVSLFGSF